MKKIKNLDNVLKGQAQFIAQVVMTNFFLHVYAGNPDEFHLLLSQEVKDHYRFDEADNNAEHVWESIDEMCQDLMGGYKKFQIVQTGIYPVLGFAKAKKKGCYSAQVLDAFEQFVNPESWKI